MSYLLLTHLYVYSNEHYLCYLLLFLLFFSPLQLVQYLKTIHKKADVVVDIFQRACQYLYQITLTTEGGSICIQEYKIFDSMRIYLPTPLSGILPLEEKESNIMQHTNSLDALSGMCCVYSVIDFKCSVVVGILHDVVNIHRTLIFLCLFTFTHLEIEATEVMQRRVRVDLYKVSLMKLPISFFLMCANLCKVDEGQAMCFSEGKMLFYGFTFLFFYFAFCKKVPKIILCRFVYLLTFP